jgi:hypothetical protein
MAVENIQELNLEEMSEEIGAPTTEPQPQPDPAKAATKEASGDTVSKKDLDAALSRIRELEGENKFWAAKAKGASDPKPQPQPQLKDPEPDDLDKFFADAGLDEGTAAQLLDEIGEKGVAALQKRGVVTKSQLKGVLSAMEARLAKKAENIATSRVESARSELNAEAKLLHDYPDLRDESSDFAKAAAKEFAAMVAEDPALNNYSGLRLAAKIVTAQQASSPSSGTGSLLSRAHRIAAQSPTRGSKQAASFEGDEEIEFGNDDRALLAFSARYGVTEKQIRDAKRGATSFA